MRYYNSGIESSCDDLSRCSSKRQKGFIGYNSKSGKPHGIWRSCPEIASRAVESIIPVIDKGANQQE